MTEHKLTVRQGDTDNSIAAHVWDAQHHVDWEGAKIRETEPQLMEEKGWRPSTSRYKKTATTWTVAYNSATYGNHSKTFILTLLYRLLFSAFHYYYFLLCHLYIFHVVFTVCYVIFTLSMWLFKRVFCKHCAYS